ncbi:hypothetical protein TYRP_014116 [Tyrophagus putrescentiae]|nr:hypothetical protein TYRP_008717 [Tyrophagus putrescentiae]KAH9405820.1 hypothetical protein TYRP_014116 [Tyrophagus putrescentiae]
MASTLELNSHLNSNCFNTQMNRLLSLLPYYNHQLLTIIITIVTNTYPSRHLLLLFSCSMVKVEHDDGHDDREGNHHPAFK